MVLSRRIEVREYLDRNGHSPFAAWSDRLNWEAAAKVAVALARMQQDIRAALIRWQDYKLRKRTEG